MRTSKSPMLTFGLLAAGMLTLAATLALAQGKADDNQPGDPPQSHSRGKSSPLPQIPEPPDAADEFDDGDEDDSARGPQTCPDRGNNLELII